MDVEPLGAAMGRLGHSWHLFKTSMSVVKQDKELLWMPVLSFLASVVAVLGITGIGYVGGIFPDPVGADGNVKPLALLLSFTMYVVLAFIGLYFNAAVVAAASERLAGGDPTVKSALGKANQHLLRLFLWSIVVATVNVLLQAIRAAASRGGRGADIVGQIVTGMLGFAWNVATYFMVPVLLFEDKKIGAGLKRSGSLFKQTWGETVIGQGGIGLVGSLVTFGILLVGMLLLYLVAPLGMFVVLPLLVVIVLAAIFSALLFAVVAGVYKAALYRYATTGKEAGGFSHQDLGGAFVQKPYY